MDKIEDIDEDRLWILNRLGRSDAVDEDRVRKEGGEDFSTLNKLTLLFRVSALSNAFVKLSRALSFCSESFSYNLNALRKSSAASE